ncbi:MAG: reductive dehalogenase domain-containing protein [Actinomycetota bacterium]
MHTGRNDAELRRRTRRRVRVAAGNTDADAGFEIRSDFERFSQRDDVFSRSRRDDALRDEAADRFYSTYRRPLADWRAAKGYRQIDYAFRNATWHVADVFAEMYERDDRRDGFLDPLSMLRDGADERRDCGTPEDAAVMVKHAAHAMGADLVGVAGYDERWTYTARFSAATGGEKPNAIPDTVRTVIVIGQAMDERLIDTAPSALSGAATGMGYSQDAVVLLAIAQFLRNLGYEAIPSMNDTALAIPYAIKAGLGEYGKHGLVITPEFGTSVRFGRIFTDLPLAQDRPIQFGVREMCERCDACVRACPGRAIPGGDPTTERFNESNIGGIRKWTIDGEKCFAFWSRVNSDCSVCVRVCPFTRDYTQRRNRLWLRVAGSPLRGLALRWHQRSGRGKRVQVDEWWPT